MHCPVREIFPVPRMIFNLVHRAIFFSAPRVTIPAHHAIFLSNT